MHECCMHIWRMYVLMLVYVYMYLCTYVCSQTCNGVMYTYLHVNVNIIMSETIKYLGARLDSNLSFKKHITERCKMAMWNLHKIKHIRKFLNQETCHTLVCGLVLDTLGLCQCNLGRPSQCRDCQNAMSTKYCSKTCMGADSYSSPTEYRIKLHWLPVRVWIQYKILFASL